jgi:hypothetical protein
MLGLCGEETIKEKDTRVREINPTWLQVTEKDPTNGSGRTLGDPKNVHRKFPLQIADPINIRINCKS